MYIIPHEKLHGTPGPMGHYRGTTKVVNGNPVWTGQVNFAPQKTLTKPLRWTRPRRIFVNSMSDLFHANVPNEQIDAVFAVMHLATQHEFQLLTKRAERAHSYLRDTATLGRLTNRLGYEPEWPLPNVWLGVSVEDQKRADERIPLLLDTPAAIRWISAEPLLGPVNLCGISTMRYRGAEVLNALTGTLEGMFGDYCSTLLPALDWVVLGGESGPGARPMHPEWARTLRDQCQEVGVPFFMKQLSGPRGRAIKDIDQFPEDLRIRIYPSA